MDLRIHSLLAITALTMLLMHGPGERVNKSQEDKYSQCLAKSSSAWGSVCGQCQNSSKTYRINLKNVCDEKLDVKVCVQERSMRWRTFNQSNVAPGDTISAYACEGTGKWIFWTKATGDNTVIFPTDDEIEKEFSPKK